MDQTLTVLSEIAERLLQLDQNTSTTPLERDVALLMRGVLAVASMAVEERAASPSSEPTTATPAPAKASAPVDPPTASDPIPPADPESQA